MRALACVFLIACGGGDTPIEGDPLIQTTLMAQFNNREWTPAYGFGRTAGTNFEIFVGGDKISCADDLPNMPRDGSYGGASVPAPPTVGTYATAPFTLFEIVDGDIVSRATAGSVQMTAVGPISFSAVLAFDVTENGGRYALNGAVTMRRCP